MPRTNASHWLFKRSRGGLVLSLLFVGLTAALVLYGLQADYKGRFVLLQLPIAVQLSLLESLGLGDFLDMSWTSAYFLIWLPTVILLYVLALG